jgi:hypothetical protein
VSISYRKQALHFEIERDLFQTQRSNVQYYIRKQVGTDRPFVDEFVTGSIVLQPLFPVHSLC